nr:TonB-dependent receptor plug domain-containing protein [Chitinophagaceae bacterium]
MSSVSARTFSMEEVNRYAGGRSDPARLAANFAGVSAPDDSRNDIVIRGNSPSGVLWRIEGMNVPNPNHFATIGTTGGPVSALNTNMLKSSDFFTSAFPAEYGNANAGVFDLGFRKGNADKREHTIQFGMLTGLEAMTEGPIKKGDGSSYLIAYRYSFTGIAQAMGVSVGTAATPFYQDLSFKVTSGNTKLGRFTLFGIGGKSKIEFLHNKIDSTDLFADPSADSYFTSDIGVLGLKHYIQLNKNSYINTVIGATYSASDFNLDTINKTSNEVVRAVENKTNRKTYNLNSSFNSKINSRLFVKIGLQADVMNLDLDYRYRRYETTWKEVWNYDDITTLFQGYAHAKYNFSDKLTLNVGLHSQLLTLNNAVSLEPRIGLKYAVNEKGTLSMGYGLHSQMQTLDVYFYKEVLPDGSFDESNQQLGFTRSHHWALSYDYLPNKDWRVKTELYYQSIFNVPVSKASNSFSMLNNGASFNPTNKGFLVNEGSGSNYGVELTIEKFFSQGYYGLLTGSLYESKYKGSDGIERNTAFNGKYVVNALVGKEFKLGKQKRNTIFTDLKLTSAGGRYFTPIDLAASQLANEQIEQGDNVAFTSRNPNFFRLDFKAGFTYNSKRKKVSHSFFFDVQNVTNHKNVFAERYNTVTNTMNTAYQIGVFPNFIYKLQF